MIFANLHSHTYLCLFILLFPRLIFKSTLARSSHDPPLSHPSATGLPIALCAIYLGVSSRLGIPLEGLGMPGHFIMRLRVSALQSDCIYVDAFRAQSDGQGLMLEDEVLGLLPILRIPDGGEDNSLETFLRRYACLPAH